MERIVRPRPDGGARVHLGPGEHAMLRSLPHQLEAVLTQRAGPGAVHARLLPPAYDDPEADAEYRELISESLVEEKLEALRAFAETLTRSEGTPPRDETAAAPPDSARRPAPDEEPRAGDEHGGGSRVIELEPGELEPWLAALNDARLALGVVAGIESEEQWQEVDTSEPTHAALLYLGALQEELLEVLTGRPDA